MRYLPMPNYSDEEFPELFPLSWIAQYGYCQRRCSLLALEQVWQENEYTAAGRMQHKRVHTARSERRGEEIHMFEMPVFSKTLGVTGFCDCVEAHPSPAGISIPYGDGLYTLYPVEYKHGVIRDEEEYHLQLCAQAICLEEQFDTRIPAGAIFFLDAHRRDEVVLSESLRKKTRKTAGSILDLLQNQELFPAVYSAKCKKCSLREHCQPQIKRSARTYHENLWNDVLKERV